jgi:CheY-like chemotaxis protein
LETPPLTVLVVEDNLAHQKITEYGLKKSSVPLAIRVVRDGQEALDYLFRRSPYADPSTSPTPDLILLDLNIPKRDGREVLQVIKHDPGTKDIPVVIVSTSDREEDVNYAFQTGAVAYISKSSGFDKLNEQLAGVHAYARRPKS